MRVGLVIEAANFPVSAAPVEGLSLGQRLVGLEPEQRDTPLERQRFEPLEDALPDPQASCRRRDPHPLDLTEVPVALEGAAPDRLALQRGEEKAAVRRRQLFRRRGYPAARIETCLEPCGQLIEIALE